MGRPGGTTAFTTAQGKLVEWCRVYRQSETHYVLLCNQSRGTQLHAWIEKYIIIEDVEVKDASGTIPTLEFGEESSQRFEDLESRGRLPPSGTSIREVAALSQVGIGSVASTVLPQNADSARTFEDPQWRTIAAIWRDEAGYQPPELTCFMTPLVGMPVATLDKGYFHRLDSYDKVARGTRVLSSTRMQS